MTRSAAKLCALALALILLALAAALAQAEVAQQGDLRVTVDGKLSPNALPRAGAAPVAVTVSGKIATTDGAAPPPLQKLEIEINRHGRIESAGLPACPRGQILNASNGRALAACGSSLVGRGRFFGAITLPGSPPYPIEGKLLAFNGREHGKPVLYGHIYSPHPFATSFLIAFQITSARHGAYGTALTADLAKALGGKRSLTGLEMTLSRRYSYKGKPRSYVSAGCPAPKGFPGATYPLARTSFSFASGASLTAVINRSCKAKG
jgi:hypothetical protein